MSSHKEIFQRLVAFDPHRLDYRLALALCMDEDDLFMLPLNTLTCEGKEEEDEVAYAYTRSDLLARDFVPHCCKIGLVGEFAGRTVVGCCYAWFKRLEEVLSPRM